MDVNALFHFTETSNHGRLRDRTALVPFLDTTASWRCQVSRLSRYDIIDYATIVRGRRATEAHFK
jgi:hypothetical protein